MAYATLEDLKARCRRDLTSSEESICEIWLEDAAVIIDAYGANASDDAKLIVSCQMIIRALGDGDESAFAQVPVGSTQGTMSALGYSQTWALSSGGSTGELYLTKMEKKLLGSGDHIGASSPLESVGA